MNQGKAGRTQREEMTLSYALYRGFNPPLAHGLRVSGECIPMLYRKRF